MSVIDLKGRIAIVTGGAMGIGKVFCKGLEKEGLCVVSQIAIKYVLSRQ